jgi:DNA-binding GntR family transcriptional regulator
MHLQPVSDVIAVRRILEPAAVQAIPAVAVSSTAEQCQASFSKMSSAFKRGDMATAVRHHTSFHIALTQHAASQLHRTLLASMIHAAEAAQLEIFRTPHAGGHSLARHAEILAALESGDVERTARQVAEHLVPAFRYSLDDAEPEAQRSQ